MESGGLYYRVLQLNEEDDEYDYWDEIRDAHFKYDGDAERYKKNFDTGMSILDKYYGTFLILAEGGGNGNNGGNWLNKFG